MQEEMYGDLDKEQKPKKLNNNKVVQMNKVVKLTVDGNDVLIPNPDYVKSLENRLQLLQNELFNFGQRVRVLEQKLQNMNNTQADKSWRINF